MPDFLPRCLRRTCHALLALFALTAAPASASQDPEVIRTVVGDYLRSRAAELPGAPEIVVALDNLQELAACESLSAFQPGRPRLRTRMSVGVRCDAPEPWTIHVTVTVKVPGTYFVAARGIAAGETLSAAHVASRQGDLLALPQGAALQADALIGAVATRRIAAGQVLRGNALRSAQSIERGRKVRLVVIRPGLVATSEGEAMATGAPGDYIQVRTASGQVVSGVVRDGHTVEILQ